MEFIKPSTLRPGHQSQSVEITELIDTSNPLIAVHNHRWHGVCRRKAPTLQEGTMRKTLMIIMSFIVINGCGEETPDPSAPSKDEAHETKADGWDVCVIYGLYSGCDLCEAFGWYGDGECDQSLIDAGICLGPDPDCQTTGAVELDLFRVSMGGMCPPGMDCSGFIELHADGTLLVDRVGEALAEPHQATITTSELEVARAVLTDEDLVALLDLDGPACVEPMDIHEQMTLTDTNGIEHTNGTTFCDQEPIVAARDLLNELADRYFAEDVTFGSFRLFRTHGPCDPDMDCSGFIELQENGTLLVDRFNGDEVPEQATVSDADLEDAILVLTNAELISLLDLDQPPCDPPTDIYETMTLTEIDGLSHDNSTTFCDQAPLQAARDILNRLADEYLPEPVATFGSFRLFRSYGPCPPEMVDCDGYIELLGDGTLLHDPVGEAVVEPYSATITDAELSDAIAVLIDADLVNLLDIDGQICEPPTDIYEAMTLTDDDGIEHSNSTTMCNNSPIAAARNLLNGLKDIYFPSH